MQIISYLWLVPVPSVGAALSRRRGRRVRRSAVGDTTALLGPPEVLAITALGRRRRGMMSGGLGGGVSDHGSGVSVTAVTMSGEAASGRSRRVTVFFAAYVLVVPCPAA
jgi:hypothetical protein